jgi:hypothetical protein
MKKRNILFRVLELQVGVMTDGSNRKYVDYYDGADPLFWLYADDDKESHESLIARLDAMIDEKYPYVVYRLLDGPRDYRSTDITEITEFAIKLGLLGHVNEYTRVSFPIKLQA